MLKDANTLLTGAATKIAEAIGESLTKEREIHGINGNITEKSLLSGAAKTMAESLVAKLKQVNEDGQAADAAKVRMPIPSESKLQGR
jgi:hypothetical protein